MCLAPASPWQTVRAMTQLVWWKNALTTSFLFAPRCIAPALIWSALGLISFGGLGYVTTVMAVSSNPGLPELIKALVILLVTSVVSITLLLWGISTWMMRLTAYCHSLLLLAPETLLSESIDKNLIKQTQETAFSDVRNHRAHIAKVWFLVTLYMSVPLALLLIIFMVEFLSRPELIGIKLFTLEPALELGLVLVGSLLMIFVTLLSLLALAASAHFQVSASQIAGRVFKLSFSLFLPAVLVTVVILVLNIVVSSPDLLLELKHPEQILSTKWDPRRGLVEHIWQAVTSLMMWPLTTTPFCQLVRGRID